MTAEQILKVVSNVGEHGTGTAGAKTLWWIARALFEGKSVRWENFLKLSLNPVKKLIIIFFYFNEPYSLSVPSF